MNRKSAYIIFIVLSHSACGVSTPGGYVLGTTGYLETYNRSRVVQREYFPEQERMTLSDMIRKGSK